MLERRGDRRVLSRADESRLRVTGAHAARPRHHGRLRAAQIGKRAGAQTETRRGSGRSRGGSCDNALDYFLSAGFTSFARSVPRTAPVLLLWSASFFGAWAVDLWVLSASAFLTGAVFAAGAVTAGLAGVAGV